MTRAKTRSWTMSVAGAVAAVGLAAIVRGVAMAWLPGAWILGGFFVAVPAVFIAYAAFGER